MRAFPDCALARTMHHGARRGHGWRYIFNFEYENAIPQR
jgi:hypothetical protein